MTIRALLALLLLAPALAAAQNEWPSDVRRKLVDECLRSCSANAAYTSIQRADCPPLCECHIKEAQTFMTADDARALLAAFAANKPDALRQRYEAQAAVCAKRVFR